MPSIRIIWKSISGSWNPRRRVALRSTLEGITAPPLYCGSEQPQGFLILARRLLDHRWGQLRCGWTPIPAGAGEIITYVLLVKTWLTVSRGVPFQRPET